MASVTIPDLPPTASARFLGRLRSMLLSETTVLSAMRRAQARMASPRARPISRTRTSRT